MRNNVRNLKDKKPKRSNCSISAKQFKKYSKFHNLIKSVPSTDLIFQCASKLSNICQSPLWIDNHLSNYASPHCISVNSTIDTEWNNDIFIMCYLFGLDIEDSKSFQLPTIRSSCTNNVDYAESFLYIED